MKFDIKWFNISSPLWMRPLGAGCWPVCLGLFTLFNRVSVDGHFWGAGLLQLGQRHLFFIGNRTGGPGLDLCLLFIWLSNARRRV